MSELPFAVTTPVSVSRVGLKARDADALAAYYRTVVGLEEIARDGETITLGAAERPLLVIERDAAARPDDPRSAGLFHIAFLLPSRADLGRWINHAIADGIRIEGASDHLVSEALYPTRRAMASRSMPTARLPSGRGTDRPLPLRRNAWICQACVLLCRRGTPVGKVRRKTPSLDMSICAWAIRLPPRNGGAAK